MKRFLTTTVLLLALSANLFGFGGFLRQSTSAVIVFGPFVLPTDGVTLVVNLATGLDNGTTGIRLFKNGGAGAVRHATVTATTYDSFGYYLVTLDATDTATLGRLKVTYADSATCLPVVETYQIVPDNVFLSLYPITTATNLNANVAAINSIATTSVTTVSAYQGTTQPVNFTGTGATAYPKVDVTDISGAAVSTTTAQLGVNAVQIAAAVPGSATIGTVSTLTNRIFRKNQAFSNFTFKLVLSADHLTAATGKAVTATRSLDGGAFASCANSVTEISNGFYKINLADTDLNGNTVTFRFTATACDSREITYILEN